MSLALRIMSLSLDASSAPPLFTPASFLWSLRRRDSWGVSVMLGYDCMGVEQRYSLSFNFLWCGQRNALICTHLQFDKVALVWVEAGTTSQPGILAVQECRVYSLEKEGESSLCTYTKHTYSITLNKEHWQANQPPDCQTHHQMWFLHQRIPRNLLQLTEGGRMSTVYAIIQL